MATVDIVFPKHTFITFQSIEEPPVAPSEYLNEAFIAGEPLWIKTESGDLVMWNLDGTITVVTPDGIKKHWWPKPKLAEAVAIKMGQATYFQFNKDGSVMAKCFGRTYYWPPLLDADVHTECVKGEILYPLKRNGEWVEDDTIYEEEEYRKVDYRDCVW